MICYPASCSESSSEELARRAPKTRSKRASFKEEADENDEDLEEKGDSTEEKKLEDVNGETSHEHDDDVDDFTMVLSQQFFHGSNDCDNDSDDNVA